MSAHTLLDDLARARRNDPEGARRNPLTPTVSDLYGCDRATWYRRNGCIEPPKSDATLRKFDWGHAYEAQVAKRLIEAGEIVHQGLAIAVYVNDLGRVEGRRLTDELPLREIEVSGHPDIVLGMFDELIEVKSTDIRKPKDECDRHYALQAAAYALGCGIDVATVLVGLIVPFDKPEVAYDVPVAELEPRVAQRIREVLENTAPGAPMPPAEPPPESAAWACLYCPHGQCPANQNERATDTTTAAATG